MLIAPSHLVDCAFANEQGGSFGRDTINHEVVVIVEARRYGVVGKFQYGATVIEDELKLGVGGEKSLQVGSTGSVCCTVAGNKRDLDVLEAVR